MATILTVKEVLDTVETDLADSVLQRLIETAEDDVREYLTPKQRLTLPTILFDKGYAVVLGTDDGTLTVPTLGNYPYVRFEGTYGVGDASFMLDTSYLQTAGIGTVTVTPGRVAAAEFIITANTERTELTFDALLTTEPVTITRILGLCTISPPSQMVSAAIDLVKLAVPYDGIRSERVGEFSQEKLDLQAERFKVLKRLIFMSDESLIS